MNLFSTEEGFVDLDRIIWFKYGCLKGQSTISLYDNLDSKKPILVSHKEEVKQLSNILCDMLFKEDTKE